MAWMKNIMISGLPRTGKTTRAVTLFQQIKHNGMFINIQGEDYLKSYPQIYRSKDWTGFKTKMVFTPANPAQGLDMIKKIYAFQKSQRTGSTLYPISIIIDEIWKYQNNKKDIQLLVDLFSAGLRWNIQVIGTAQLPSMVAPNIYKNTHIFIFYQLNDALYAYFSRVWKIDLFELRQHLNRPFNYVIYDGRKFYPKTPEQQ